MCTTVPPHLGALVHLCRYEGSMPGRIVEELVRAGCMDPIIYFDELDKVARTTRGDEIINALIHLTDPQQNCDFRDRYLQGISIDLSRAIFAFSFNDRSDCADSHSHPTAHSYLLNSFVVTTAHYQTPSRCIIFHRHLALTRCQERDQPDTPRSPQDRAMSRT